MRQLLSIARPPVPTLLPYTTLFRSNALKFRSAAPPAVAIDAERADGGDWVVTVADNGIGIAPADAERIFGFGARDRKSTRLNSSHLVISYAVFCLTKKNTLSKLQQD